MKQPRSNLIIGISGGSGSGKTTLARELQARLGDESCGVLLQDHYYIDQSARFTGDGESVNFDHPDALDFPLMARHLEELERGREIAVPIYDFPTHKRLAATTLFRPRPVVVVDGILILSQAIIRDRLAYRVFVEAEESLRFSRRLERDVRERGRTPEGVRKQFERQVKPMHDLFVEPSKAFAHRVVSGAEPFDGELELLLEICAQVLRGR